MKDLRTRSRVADLLLVLINRPYRYTLRQLADKYGVSIDAIKNDRHALRGIGIETTFDDKYRYAIESDANKDAIAQLRALSREEIGQIKLLVDHDDTYFDARQRKQLIQKLDRLIDPRRLGLRALRQPNLQRIDALNEAIKLECRAKLIDYRSRSSATRTRAVEPFHLDTDHEILHAYDLESDMVKHFALSRMERIEIERDVPWQHRSKHVVLQTDDFRISSSPATQDRVELELNTSAYNSLIEQYPLALRHIESAATPGRFHYAADVNGKYFGLSNFILSNWRGVEVLGSEVLITELRKQLEDFSKKL